MQLITYYPVSIVFTNVLRKVRRVEVIARVDELHVNMRFHKMNPNVTIGCNIFRPRIVCLGQKIVIAEYQPRMRIYS